MSRKGMNIYKRKDGRWEARYVKKTDQYGKKLYGSVYGKTYTEAREKQIKHLQNKKIYQNNNSNITLARVAAEWLLYIESDVKTTTFQKYSYVINKHLLTHSMAEQPLCNITNSMYSEYAKSKLKSGSLSEKTINDILMVLGRILAFAEENYQIKRSKLPHIKEPRKETRVLSVAEQSKLESYLHTNIDIYQFGVLLALYTGIRLGELCALRWEDISDDSIKISKTMHRVKKGDKTIVEIAEPKTKSSYRIIPLPKFFCPYISFFRSSGTVLKTRNGNHVEPRLLQMSFAKMIEECMLPKTNFHALRHTFATRCIESGFDIKSLSEILGHSDVKTTLNKYVHSSYEQKQKNMNLLQPICQL